MINQNICYHSIMDNFCGLCKYFNAWHLTYVNPLEVPACCAYWHIAYSSKNVARRKNRECYCEPTLFDEPKKRYKKPYQKY